MKVRKIYIPFVVVAITYLLLYGSLRGIDYKQYWTLRYISHEINTIKINDWQLTKEKIFLQALQNSDPDSVINKHTIHIFYRDGIQSVSPDMDLADTVLEIKAFDFEQHPVDSLLIIQYNIPVAIYLNGEIIYTPEQMDSVSRANLKRAIPIPSSNNK